MVEVVLAPSSSTPKRVSSQHRRAASTAAPLPSRAHVRSLAPHSHLASAYARPGRYLRNPRYSAGNPAAPALDERGCGALAAGPETRRWSTTQLRLLHRPRLHRGWCTQDSMKSTSPRSILHVKNWHTHADRDIVVNYFVIRLFIDRSRAVHVLDMLSAISSISSIQIEFPRARVPSSQYLADRPRFVRMPRCGRRARGSGSIAVCGRQSSDVAYLRCHGRESLLKKEQCSTMTICTTRGMLPICTLQGPQQVDTVEGRKMVSEPAMQVSPCLEIRHALDLQVEFESFAEKQNYFQVRLQ
ncbi:hypothetical protein EJB05_32897, partial [Eragrostis curvula]